MADLSLVGSGRPCSDVENAYSQLPLSPSDWRFAIISWRNSWRCRERLLDDIFLVLVTSANCSTFNRVWAAVEYILEKCCREGASFEETLRALMRYLDSFLILVTSEEETNRLLDMILHVMRDLNFPVKKFSG